VDGKTLRRQESTTGVVHQHGPIEVEDETFRDGVWKKWAGGDGKEGARDVLARDDSLTTCSVCKKNVDVEVSLHAQLLSLMWDIDG
jgi:hypothetical protein